MTFSPIKKETRAPLRPSVLPSARSNACRSWAVLRKTRRLSRQPIPAAWTCSKAHVGLHDHLFGSRPSIADFGLLGQLKTLATDPTPLAIMRERAQRTESWTRQLDDASGLEGEWYPAHVALPEATVGLLRLAAETYLPFLVANAAAAEYGDEKFEVKLLGQTYIQAPFGYQRKCLAALRKRFAALNATGLDEIGPLLEETGCLPYLSH